MVQLVYTISDGRKHNECYGCLIFKLLQDKKREKESQ